MALLTLILVVAACGDDADGITVAGAWARNSPIAAAAGAGYMQLTSPVDDVLVGIAVEASFARAGELHDVIMVAIDTIPLPADETVVLEPGHLHLMFVGLMEPLETGDTFEVTLQFETAADMVVEFEVFEEAP